MKIPLKRISYDDLLKLSIEQNTQLFVKDKEIERLNNIINEAINYIDDNTYYKDHKGYINIDDVYTILKGVDKK